MAELQDAVIVSAVRTAIGTYGGGMAEVSAVKLGEICIRAALERSGVKADAAHTPARAARRTPRARLLSMLVCLFTYPR